jgi:Zn-finger nucleic acid-binding protein
MMCRRCKIDHEVVMVGEVQVVACPRVMYGWVTGTDMAMKSAPELRVRPVDTDPFVLVVGQRRL